MRVTTSAHLSSKLSQEEEATQVAKSIVSGSGGQLAKLPYIILDNHISKTEALHLLGRIVCNVRRPLECYVPETSACASHDTLHACWTTESKANGPSRFTITAQGTYPDYDPELFVLPNLPVSISESTSATLSERSNYSSRTQSLLSSLLGLSFSLQKAASNTFTLNAKALRVLSLNQHSKVFSKLMGLYGDEIKMALKEAGGTMYFVVGIKLCTDATVETRKEGQRLIAGNVMVNATQITGLGTRGTSGVELGQVLSGRDVQKGLGTVTTEDIKGERAFAVEYCCVRLQRRLEFHMISRVARNKEFSSSTESSSTVNEIYRNPLADPGNLTSPPKGDQLPVTSGDESRRLLPEETGITNPCIIAPPCSEYSRREVMPASPSPPKEDQLPVTSGDESRRLQKGPRTAEPYVIDISDPSPLEPDDDIELILRDRYGVDWQDDMDQDWQPEAEENTNLGDDDGFEVVLGDELYMETFDCLG